MNHSILLQTKTTNFEAQKIRVEKWLAAQTPPANPASIVWVNPDASLKIDQVRSLITATTYQPYLNHQQWFVILQADQTGIPAQNALLKLLEEPPKHSTMLLVTAQPTALLETIQSRCVLMLESESSETALAQNTVLPDWQSTSNQTFTELIGLAGQLPDRESAIQELNSWLQAIHSDPSHPSPATASALASVATAIDQLRRNANLKLVLEHCFFQLKQSQAGSF